MDRQRDSADEMANEARPGDESAIERIVDETRAGRGLGGRTLGELGTTGGTNVGAGQQRLTETGVPGRRTPAGHASDPGVAGRTARGGLGTDLDDEVAGHQDREPSLLPEEEPADGERSTPRD
jgi:hypothetical protein